jgi:hypothetical protein
MAKKQKTPQDALAELNLQDLVRALTQSILMFKAYSKMGVMDKVLANPDMLAKFNAKRDKLVMYSDELSKRFNAPVHYT